jgi:four helix bundle protein
LLSVIKFGISLSAGTKQRASIPAGQFTEAADSISANIAEGYGRYHVRESINFCFYARGSILECKDWLYKCFHRKLVTAEQYDELFADLKFLHGKLNGYIKHLYKNSRTVLRKSK